VLARARVVLFQFQLFWLGTWVFLSDVKIAGVSSAEQFNLKGRWLCHDTNTPNLVARPDHNNEICAQTALKTGECQA